MATEQQQQQQQRSRQPNFSRLLRKDKETFDLVQKLVQHLAASTEQDFTQLWSLVTDRDEAHFKRHFRRQRRKKDPFAGIKNAVPAYSFFTQEWNSKIAGEKENEGKSFGEISKLVGQKWKGLSAKEKSKYEKLAAKDKKRYQDEIEQRSIEITQQQTQQIQQTPTEHEPVSSEATPTPAKSSGSKRKSAARK